VSNVDTSKCPDACFRPVGLAWDNKGRLFMSSDATGEVYVITRAGGGSAHEVQPSPTATNTGQASPSASKPGRAGRESVEWWMIGVGVSVVLGMVV
jgi:hypothetical protein